MDLDEKCRFCLSTTRVLLEMTEKIENFFENFIKTSLKSVPGAKVCIKCMVYLEDFENFLLICMENEFKLNPSSIEPVITGETIIKEELTDCEDFITPDLFHSSKTLKDLNEETSHEHHYEVDETYLAEKIQQRLDTLHGEGTTESYQNLEEFNSKVKYAVFRAAAHVNVKFFGKTSTRQKSIQIVARSIGVLFPKKLKKDGIASISSSLAFSTRNLKDKVKPTHHNSIDLPYTQPQGLLTDDPPALTNVYNLFKTKLLTYLQNIEADAMLKAYHGKKDLNRVDRRNLLRHAAFVASKIFNKKLVHVGNVQVVKSSLMDMFPHIFPNEDDLIISNKTGPLMQVLQYRRRMFDKGDACSEVKRKKTSKKAVVADIEEITIKEEPMDDDLLESRER